MKKNVIFSGKKGTAPWGWALFAILCCGLAAAQPTVTVPQGVIVVETGSGPGVTLGDNGTVGNGGVVLMPDPGNGGFTVHANGDTLTTWTLRGDLSFIEYPATIDQSKPVTGTVETIYSYNKTPRDAEFDEITQMSYARSKGEVAIGYTRPGCGSNSIRFQVYKTYTSPLPEIVGEECWVPNERYTYSVDQIASDNLHDNIGLDEYYWTVSNGAQTIDPDDYDYTSADNSSITFTAPSDISGNWVIECCFGRGNGWDGNAAAAHTTCVTFPVGVEPTEPELDIPECVPVEDTSLNVSVVDPDPAYEYTWTASNDTWTFSNSNGSSTTVNGLGGAIRAILSLPLPQTVGILNTAIP